MDWENKRRDQVQGVVVVESGESGDSVVELPSAGLDRTDWEQENFRYIL
jgi:ACS family allantoate permease-like MFS transporter